MVKIFRYELKRLILNKYFLVLLILTFIVGFQEMNGTIILGVANTAPFSAWSFGTYIANILPIALITLLFFISFFYSKEEQCVKTITAVTPVSQIHHLLLRLLVVTISFILVLSPPVLYAFAFYKKVFDYTSFTLLLRPLLYAILPSFLCIMGLGLLLGSIKPAFIFALIPMVLILSKLDLCGRTFFMTYPKTLGILDPDFRVPLNNLLIRCAYSLAGMVMIVIALKKTVK